MAGQGTRRRTASKAPAQEEQTGPRTCGPCRGTGKLLSGAGGTQHAVVCPWCEGTGTEIPDHDAQANPAERPA